MILYVVETLRANGSVMADNGFFYLSDAAEDACQMSDEDKCCNKNTSDDYFIGPCPGGCETRTPRVVEYKAERIEK